MCSLCLQCRGLLDLRTTCRLCMVLHGFACLLIRCGVLLVVNLRCALLFRCFPSSSVAASGSLPRGGILLAAWEFTPLLLQTLKCFTGCLVLLCALPIGRFPLFSFVASGFFPRGGVLMVACCFFMASLVWRLSLIMSICCMASPRAHRLDCFCLQLVGFWLLPPVAVADSLACLLLDSWGVRLFSLRSLVLHLCGFVFRMLCHVFCFMLGWEPCIIFGYSHNHCPFFRCLYFFSCLLLWSLREPVPFLFILVSTFAGSPAMYIFDLLIHLHFDQKKRKSSTRCLLLLCALSIGRFLLSFACVPFPRGGLLLMAC